MSVHWEHSIACGIHEDGLCSCKEDDYTLTVPARRPEDQQYQKCVDQKCVDALDRLAWARYGEGSGWFCRWCQADKAGGHAYGCDLATLSEALERQQSRIYILENMRSENYIEELEAAEAEVRQLREELRQARAYIDSLEQR